MSKVYNPATPRQLSSEMSKMYNSATPRQFLPKHAVIGHWNEARMPPEFHVGFRV